MGFVYTVWKEMHCIIFQLTMWKMHTEDMRRKPCLRAVSQVVSLSCFNTVLQPFKVHRWVQKVLWPCREDWIILFYGETSAIYRHLRYCGVVTKQGKKSRSPCAIFYFLTVDLVCFTDRTHKHTHTLTTPKKPARSTASLLASLRTSSVFSVYVFTSDSSLPKALTVRRLLIRSSANYTHMQTWKSDYQHSKFTLSANLIKG